MENGPLKLMLNYPTTLGIPLKPKAIWAWKKIPLRFPCEGHHDLHLILSRYPWNDKSFIVVLHDNFFATILWSHYTTICQSCCTAIHPSNISNLITSCSKKTTTTKKPWKWVMKQHLMKMFTILKCQVHLNTIPLSRFINS
jgi:hypothetical protein